MAISSEARAQAAIDLNAKLRLETSLRPKVRQAQDDTVREATRVLAQTGRLPDVAAIEAAAFEPILREHYDKAASVFNRRVSDQLPEELGLTNAEKAAIAAALAAYFAKRAPAQAKEIGSTSAKNARRAVTLANVESRSQFSATGIALSLAEEAVITGVLFSRSERGRVPGILVTETQAAAEVSKLQENRTLLGDNTPLGEETAKPLPALQDWVDQGDDRVRTSPGDGHRGSRIKPVPVGEPFIVGGQRLLFPGDQSLGATINNVANCRCSSVARAAAMAGERREVLATAGGQDFVPPAPAPAPTRPRVADPDPKPGVTPPGQPNLDADTSLGKWTTSSGELLPERAQLHRDILDDFAQGAIVKPRKTLQLVGGGTASGKGTVIGTGKVNLPTKAVSVDADAIKGKLPEFQAAAKAKDPNGAAFVHAESSKISDKLLMRAKEDGFDTILDGTGNGSLEKLKRRVQPFKDAGYKVKADYVTVPTDVAVERALKRGQETGRFVPESVTREIHAGVSKTFPEAVRADLFDEVRLFDTNVAYGDDPFLIYEKIDGVERIVDGSKWRDFLAKGNE